MFVSLSKGEVIRFTLWSYICPAHAQIQTFLAMDFLVPILANVADYK